MVRLAVWPLLLSFDHSSLADVPLLLYAYPLRIVNQMVDGMRTRYVQSECAETA